VPPTPQARSADRLLSSSRLWPRIACLRSDRAAAPQARRLGVAAVSLAATARRALCAGQRRLPPAQGWEGSLLYRVRRFRKVAAARSAPAMRAPGTVFPQSGRAPTRPIGTWRIDLWKVGPSAVILTSSIREGLQVPAPFRAPTLVPQCESRDGCGPRRPCAAGARSGQCGGPVPLKAHLAGRRKRTGAMGLR
jgi:hypothetical protein